MVKLKGPIHSLDARGTISKAISFVKRHAQNIAEKKPEILDVQSTAQLSWRHMFLKCTALWNALSAVEQAEWESLARPKHITGYAYWQSQCLRPNPGIYLPLQGGTMSGDIDMAKHRLLKLPAPADAQEPFRLSDYSTYVLPYLHRQGARVYHNANQVIPHNAPTILAFNSERWDTDAIHDLIVNNSRLTCQTAGKYIVCFCLFWAASAVGDRRVYILHSGDGMIFRVQEDVLGALPRYQSGSTIADLAVGEFLRLQVFQNCGGPLTVFYGAWISPEFMMHRISP